MFLSSSKTTVKEQHWSVRFTSRRMISMDHTLWEPKTGQGESRKTLSTPCWAAMQTACQQSMQPQWLGLCRAWSEITPANWTVLTWPGGHNASRLLLWCGRCAKTCKAYTWGVVSSPRLLLSAAGGVLSKVANSGHRRKSVWPKSVFPKLIRLKVMNFSNASPLQVWPFSLKVRSWGVNLCYDNISNARRA